MQDYKKCWSFVSYMFWIDLFQTCLHHKPFVSWKHLMQVGNLQCYQKCVFSWNFGKKEIATVWFSNLPKYPYIGQKNQKLTDNITKPGEKASSWSLENKWMRTNQWQTQEPHGISIYIRGSKRTLMNLRIGEHSNLQSLQIIEKKNGPIQEQVKLWGLFAIQVSEKHKGCTHSKVWRG